MSKYADKKSQLEAKRAAVVKNLAVIDAKIAECDRGIENERHEAEQRARDGAGSAETVTAADVGQLTVK